MVIVTINMYFLLNFVERTLRRSNCEKKKNDYRDSEFVICYKNVTKKYLFVDSE